MLPAGIGSAVSLSNLPAGTYVFEVTDLSPPLDPDGNALAACTDLFTVRVEEPDALSMVLIDSYDPLCPEDIALGGRLGCSEWWKSIGAALYNIIEQWSLDSNLWFLFSCCIQQH